MLEYQIFALPLLAFALVVFFPIFEKDLSLPDSWWSRRRRRVYLGRVLIVAMLLATLITIIWPVHLLKPLVQGIVVIAMLMLPFLVAHRLMSRRYVKNRSGSEAAIIQSAEQKPVVGNEQEAVVNTSTRPGVSTSVGHRGDVDVEIQAQMRKVSNLVQSVELDESDIVSPELEDPEDKIRKSRDTQVANHTALANTSTPLSGLESLSTPQIKELVASLRRDKGRLQKLVVAQQAAINSERKAHERTRILTRDAIKIMRDARTSQKQAEKLARRERAERVRIEQHYKKVAHALRNAMSIIEKRKVTDARGRGEPAIRPLDMAEKHA